MAAISLNSYNATTGCLYFTISGTPTPTSVTVQLSTDEGVTWTDFTGTLTSPRCGYIVTEVTWFRLKLNPNGELSNIISSDGQIIRTAITSESQITFANSPIYIRNTATAEAQTVYLWVWSGALNKTLGNANSILQKSKISADDTYIEFKVQDLILPYLIPNFAFNEIDMPAVSGQVVFWQAQTFANGVFVSDTGTNIATTGYRWSYEQNFILGNNGILPNRNIPYDETVNKWYNSKIHHYFTQSFDFTLPKATANTTNVLKTEQLTIPTGWSRCSLDPCLIVFINKLGLWETFTPNGKLFTQDKVDFENQNRAFRDQSRVDNTYNHYKDKRNVESTQTFVINTGGLEETMNETVKQIIFSPKVYFIRFKGDTVSPEVVGVTIDNTYITIDDTIQTIDGMPVGVDDIGYYKTFQQIPVIVTNQDFTEKKRLNDKSKIDYVLNLEQTNSSIL